MRRRVMLGLRVEGGEVFFLLEVVGLGKGVIVVLRESFIILFGLNFTTIAFLPKGKIEIVAI